MQVQVLGAVVNSLAVKSLWRSRCPQASAESALDSVQMNMPESLPVIPIPTLWWYSLGLISYYCSTDNGGCVRIFSALGEDALMLRKFGGSVSALGSSAVCASSIAAISCTWRRLGSSFAGSGIEQGR